MSSYVLTFLSGKYQHGQYPLPQDGTVTLGRTSEADVILAEDMISRRHASVSVSQGTVTITDLNSTNGTYVNGEKVARIALKPGDRILIGSSLLQLDEKKNLEPSEATQAVFVEPNALEFSFEEAAPILHTTQAPEFSVASETQAKDPTPYSMDGDLQDASLSDLLRLYAANKRTGALQLTGTTHTYHLWIQEGVLHSITQGPEHKPTHSMRILCKTLRWTEGPFEFTSCPIPHNLKKNLHHNTEDLILEATRQNDELDRLLPQLPPPDTEVRLADPLVPKFSALSKDALDVLQTALNHNTLQSMIEHAPGTDLEIVTTLLKLLNEGYLE
jgi:pSer/pThr/pTyr-binding forkhead associated (FHA) protein